MAQVIWGQRKHGGMGQPSTLTPEEDYLLKKFALLKRKRKALQRTKEKVDHAPSAVKPGLKREASVTELSQRPEDAKEKAKKLIASGTVKIKKDPVHREFKRAKIERKQKDPLQQSAFSKSDQRASSMKSLYDSFVPSGGSQNRRMSGSGGYRIYHQDEPRRGNTIFVSGYGLMESHLQKPFNKFGKVQRINFEREKCHGFVTFETSEQAEAAIDEMNGMMISGVCIKVSLARRQPNLADTQTHGRGEVWSNRDARGHSQSSQKEQREIRSYEDDDF